MISPNSMRHEAYMKMKATEEDEEKLLNEFYAERTDMVNSPPHYNQEGIECIDAIEAALGPDGFQAFCRGNVMKYTWRTDRKNGQEDLEKARWYLTRMIKRD